MKTQDAPSFIGSFCSILSLITVVCSSGSAQTSFHRDTIDYEDGLIPSYSDETDSLACGQKVYVSFPTDGVLVGHEVTHIDLYITGQALGGVSPEDIRLYLVGGVIGVPVQSNSGAITVRSSSEDDPSAPIGSFSVSRRLNFMNDLYNPDDELDITLYVYRDYQDHPSHPVCGTEEAYVDTWRMVITYYTDDLDQDGYRLSEDCNDEDPYVNPGEREYCDNGIDDNCDGNVDEIVDNYVEALPTGGYQFSQGSLDTCDHVIVPTRVTWEITQNARQLQTKFQGSSYTVYAGGKLILGGEGCDRNTEICTGEHIATPDFEIRQGGELEMGPFSMIGVEGCLFCVIDD